MFCIWLMAVLTLIAQWLGVDNEKD